MPKLYSAAEVANLCGVDRDSILYWERQKNIPPAIRIGKNNRRLWADWKVREIIAYAQSIGHGTQRFHEEILERR